MTSPMRENFGVGACCGIETNNRSSVCLKILECVAAHWIRKFMSQAFARVGAERARRGAGERVVVAAATPG